MLRVSCWKNDCARARWQETNAACNCQISKVVSRNPVFTERITYGAFFDQKVTRLIFHGE